MNFVERTIAYVTGRMQSYRSSIGAPAGRLALADLADFCRANSSTFHPDPHIAARLDGRREVWLRIQQHLNLSPDQLMELYAHLKMEQANVRTEPR